MAKQSATLNNDIRLSDYLSVGLLARIIPPQVVDSALSHHGRHSQRQRDFPADTVAYYIIAMSMYRDVNTEEVMRIISEGMSYLAACRTIRANNVKIAPYKKVSINDVQLHSNRSTNRLFATTIGR